MDLINPETFFRRAMQRECMVSGRSLVESEFIVSASEVPAVYQLKAWTPSTLSTLRNIIEIVVRSKRRIYADSADSNGLRRQIRSFLECLLAQKEQVPEYCVHAFVFLFWDTIDYRGTVIPPRGEVFFTSGSLDGEIESGHRYYRLLQRLKSITNVDLIAISEEQQHIFLVEIKRGALDDRAVGQVLRYFNDANKLLTDRVVRDFNLSYIRPILVLGEATKQYMEAFPTHFREVLDVFEYATVRRDDGGLQIVLSHLRRRFLSSYMS
jgi:hypothetical protein